MVIVVGEVFMGVAMEVAVIVVVEIETNATNLKITLNSDVPHEIVVWHVLHLW